MHKADAVEVRPEIIDICLVEDITEHEALHELLVQEFRGEIQVVIVGKGLHLVQFEADQHAFFGEDQLPAGLGPLLYQVIIDKAFQ